jgi:chromate transporter
LLLIVGVLPFWNRLRATITTRAAFAGVNTSVVGVLLAALYHPVWTGTVHKPSDFTIVLAGYLALTAWEAPPVVCAIAAIGAASTLLT